MLRYGREACATIHKLMYGDDGANRVPPARRSHNGEIAAKSSYSWACPETRRVPVRYLAPHRDTADPDHGGRHHHALRRRRRGPIRRNQWVLREPDNRWGDLRPMPRWRDRFLGSPHRARERGSWLDQQLHLHHVRWPGRSRRIQRLDRQRHPDRRNGIGTRRRRTRSFVSPIVRRRILDRVDL